jgi:hypothetical protein
MASTKKMLRENRMLSSWVHTRAFALYFISLIYPCLILGGCLATASEPNNKASRYEPLQARGHQTVWSGFNFGSSWFTDGWTRSKVSISVDGNLYLIVNPVHRRPCSSETTMSYGQIPLPDRRDTNLDASVSVRPLTIRPESHPQTSPTDTVPNAPESRSGARPPSPIHRWR